LDNPVKIKVCDAPIEALNYLVAKIEALPKDRLHLFYGKPAIDRECLGRIDTFRCEFSTNWTQGGPIIDRMYAEGFEMVRGGPDSGNERVWAKLHDMADYMHGPTPLVAAMRCFVVSKLGEEIEVPDELMRKD